MKKAIITLVITFFANSAFAYNIYLINNLPTDPTNQNCNAILSFDYYNSQSSIHGSLRIVKSFQNKPVLPGKRGLVARNVSTEVLELGYLLINFPYTPFAVDTKCFGYASPKPNYLLTPELISTWHQGNTYPAIDTRPITLGNEVFETVSVKLKVSRLPGAEFNLSHLIDVARIKYVVKRKSTSTDSVNITKGILSHLRQRPFST